ncbi:Na+/H+ antiporter NhaC family protein [Bacillus alkalicellulosilyticus]|uniref:Na+/H+ antiporter NhaC family protein n=1 Tax=Alkalihalobacterium alkalicellulosilyticum TaxID=1912214 RepID=UPI000996A9C6|nr:Na+/H+ antiporter NhaC family protein [Bacillus alkalicellulosilyticus]
MDTSWFSIIPFLVVIPVAIYTKQVLPALFLGLLVGAYLMDPTILGGIQTMFVYVVQALIDTNNIKIVVFLYAFSGLVGMVKMTGGIRGFVEKAAERIQTRKQALVLTYVSTLGTFIAPTFRFVTIAPIMRALLKKVKMTTAELGFVIETTATPVIVLIPVATAFVGYMVSIIQIATQNQGVNVDPYSLFIQSIPFNFFSIVTILLGIYLSFFHHSRKKSTAPTQIDEDVEDEEDWHECHPAVDKELPIKPFNLLLPLVLVIGFTLFLTWYDGFTQGYGFFESFIQADVLDAMVVALLITVLLSMAFYLLQRFKLDELISGFINGGNDLMSVILLLSVVWGLSSITDDLGFSAFVTAHAGWIPQMFIAPLIFIFGAAVSYFIGSAWGTWGILMPLGISLAVVGDVSLPLVVGAVFASGAFGAFASPLSDDTNTIAKILGLSVIEYAKYKLKPALIAAGITTVMYVVVTFIF